MPVNLVAHILPLVAALHGFLRSEQPMLQQPLHQRRHNRPTYLRQRTQASPLGPDQFLLRWTQLRNAPWVYGIGVFTEEVMRNATATPVKRTAVERHVNVHFILFYFLC